MIKSLPCLFESELLLQASYFMRQPNRCIYTFWQHRPAFNMLIESIRLVDMGASAQHFGYTALLLLLLLFPCRSSSRCQLTAEPTAFVDSMFTVTCCASGYPEPIISINGNVEQITYRNLTDGIYHGCASRNIATLGVAAGTSHATYCHVSLSQKLTCTTSGTSSRQVPEQVIRNCNASLNARVSVTATTLIAG